MFVFFRRSVTVLAGVARRNTKMTELNLPNLQLARTLLNRRKIYLKNILKQLMDSTVKHLQKMISVMLALTRIWWTLSITLSILIASLQTNLECNTRTNTLKLYSFLEAASSQTTGANTVTVPRKTTCWQRTVKTVLQFCMVRRKSIQMSKENMTRAILV